MKVFLSPKYIELFRTTHYYPWNFWHRFGWFADRDISSMSATRDSMWIDTERKVTHEETLEIWNFFDTKEAFAQPTHAQKIVLNLDYKNMQIKVDNNISDIPDLKVRYYGEGDKQVLYCSRVLTNSEKDSLKDLWATMIEILRK